MPDLFVIPAIAGIQGPAVPAAGVRRDEDSGGHEEYPPGDGETLCARGGRP